MYYEYCLISNCVNKLTTDDIGVLKNNIGMENFYKINFKLQDQPLNLFYLRFFDSPDV